MATETKKTETRKQAHSRKRRRKRGVPALLVIFLLIIALAFGGLENGTALTLCAGMLENSGNAYDLHKRIMDQGYLCPILFKSYTVYTTRGAAQDLDPAVDWIIHGS